MTIPSLASLAISLREAHEAALLVRADLDAARSAVEATQKRLNAAYSVENDARSALLKFIHGDTYTP